MQSAGTLRRLPVNLSAAIRVQMTRVPEGSRQTPTSTGYRKLESTVRYLGIKGDEALELSEQIAL